MLTGLRREIDQVAKDKGIDKSVIIEALEEAMKQAARRKYGQEREIEARFDEDTGEIELFEFRTVVENVTPEDETGIGIEEAQEFDPEAEIGDEIGVKLDTSEFGRIVAQTAKQVIIQRVRDAERDIVFDEYQDRRGEIVNGIVRRFDKGSLIVDLGRTEAILPAKEQIPRESYRNGDRIRAYVLDVTKAVRGPQIVLSRGRIEMLTKLFEQEVPEIYEGIVTIEASAREPGARSKIAVSSRDSDVDPVGACVGMKGSRVQAVVQELRGERIDIVPWNPEPARFVCSALSPAQVSKVIIDEEDTSMDVIVPDDQLSLAIGRKGQNVRLAVQLTGWKLDITSESKLKQMSEWLSEAVSIIEGCGDPEADLLLQQGITSLEGLAECPSDLLSSLPGIDEAGAQQIKDRAVVLAKQKVIEAEEKAIADAAAAEVAAAEAAEAAAAAAAEAEAANEEATSEADAEEPVEEGAEDSNEASDEESESKEE